MIRSDLPRQFVTMMFVLPMLFACGEGAGAPEPTASAYTADAAMSGSAKIASVLGSDSGPVGDSAPSSSAGKEVPEVIVMSSAEEIGQWLEDIGWWGPEKHGEQLEAPRVLVTGISPKWRETAQKITVAEKKEAFYRLLLPLILHANEMVLRYRGILEETRQQFQRDGAVPAADLDGLRELAALFRVAGVGETAEWSSDSAEWGPALDELLYKLDIVPPGLALGQAAYESGYGTSRFASQGNALFGQWTFGGEGLKPEQQRGHLGDHRIAAFEWPFDSVRGYFINLMSHPAYEEFRRLRAERRAAGEPLASLDLADGLIRYSERGQEYVDTLKSIIRVNQLDIADDAVFRDEPMRFLVRADSPEDAVRLRAEFERMRGTGELREIYERMQLD